MGSIPIVGFQLWVRVFVGPGLLAGSSRRHLLSEGTKRPVDQKTEMNNLGGYPSGQRGLTVNQLADAFGGSNPSPPTWPTR
jgi:hypothetical protein